MNAHGPQDSYGAYIDYGMRMWFFNIIIAIIMRAFVEILGDNINCGYRQI